MQIIYKFRVAFEDHDDVVRFIDIESTSNFADFHKIIQESIGFDATKEYAFYISNDSWNVETPICDSYPREESTVKLPKQTNLNKYINDPHQRFIYSFDPELDWTFTIELVKIQKAESHKKYPLLARKEGEAPKQYKLKGKLPGAVANQNEYDKMAEMLIASRLMDDMLTDEEIEDATVHTDEEITVPNFEDIQAKLKETPEADTVKKTPKLRLPLDLKFDEEEMKIDAEDLNFMDEDEEHDDSKEDDDDQDFDNHDDDDHNSDDY